MRVFVSMGFQGHYPVGTAACVIAETEGQARALLNQELRLRGLPGLDRRDQVTEIDASVPNAFILNDGNY